MTPIQTLSTYANNVRELTQEIEHLSSGALRPAPLGLYERNNPVPVMNDRDVYNMRIARQAGPGEDLAEQIKLHGPVQMVPIVWNQDFYTDVYDIDGNQVVSMRRKRAYSTTPDLNPTILSMVHAMIEHAIDRAGKVREPKEKSLKNVVVNFLRPDLSALASMMLRLEELERDPLIMAGHFSPPAVANMEQNKQIWRQVNDTIDLIIALAHPLLSEIRHYISGREWHMYDFQTRRSDITISRLEDYRLRQWTNMQGWINVVQKAQVGGANYLAVTAEQGLEVAELRRREAEHHFLDYIKSIRLPT